MASSFNFAPCGISFCCCHVRPVGMLIGDASNIMAALHCPFPVVPIVIDKVCGLQANGSCLWEIVACGHIQWEKQSPSGDTFAGVNLKSSALTGVNKALSGLVLRCRDVSVKYNEGSDTESVVRCGLRNEAIIRIGNVAMTLCNTCKR